MDSTGAWQSSLQVPTDQLHTSQLTSHTFKDKNCSNVTESSHITAEIQLSKTGESASRWTNPTHTGTNAGSDIFRSYKELH